MYDLIDRPINELPAFERGVLDRARRWVHAFSVAGPEMGGDDALSVAMHALDRGSVADIVLQRPCFATVEEPEAVLLGLWRLVREGRSAAARAVAESLVDESHVGILLDGVAGMIGRG
ncbi:hypothetical protein [Sphingomonas bacterium]|uniref:hypothetical protein n=1 Tax=Sphingomonas bacterium TaxID=1895847 RepID=UPI001576224B|nr:hypothetical protein [Sphingomonas bacterium]